TSYGGTEFPSWIGDSSYSKLVQLELLTCPKITSLSSVGKLPALRHLSIQGLDGVKEVYAEDFQSLETLYIGDMLGWERWFWSDGVNESTLGKFPKLRVVLALRAAPDLTSLASLELHEISGLVSLQEELVQALVALEDLDLLVSLVEGEEGILPCNLEVLRLEYCSNLGKLANGLSSLTSLIDLTIYSCRKLECFSEGAGLPLSLKRLAISDCFSLRSLPDCNHCLLEALSVGACPSLKWLPKGKLPKTLKSLYISWDNQESLPEGILQRDARETPRSNLEHLTLWSFSATSFPTGEFPISLKELTIANCRIPSLPPLHFLFHLTGLTIFGCNELKWFPKEGLHLPNLISLVIDLPNLISLPTHMDSLKSLQDLRISNCHRLDYLPERGLPPNLTSLEISSCKITMPVSDWGLRKLTSLKRFSVKSTIDVDRFPDDEGFEREKKQRNQDGTPASCNSNIIFCDHEQVSSLHHLILGIEILRCLRFRHAVFNQTRRLACFIFFNIQVKGTYRHSIILGCNSVSDVHLCGQTVLYKPVQRPNERLHLKSVIRNRYGILRAPCSMAKSAFSRPMAATVMTLLVATLLLMSSEVANATLNYDGAAALTLCLHLSIQGMDGVKEVYAEDFQSLETLYFEDMLGWERWLWSDGVNEKLRIEKCQGVVLALRAAPDLTSLASLQLIKISGLVSLQEELVQALVALEYLDLQCCNELTYLWQDGVDLDKLSSLKRLWIHECEQLVSLVEGEEGILPCNLEVLTVEDCSNLGKLANGLCSLTSLRDLTIRSCRKLECFSEGAGLPLSLKRLEISSCDSLRSLPDGMMRMVNDSDCNQCLLEELSVTACPSLKWLPKGKLPKTLKYLDWDNQESLPEGILQRDARETSRSNLEHLTLQSLSATSLQTGEFPISLKKLDIFYCRIPSLPPLHFLSHLTQLTIFGCNELKSFPKGGLPLPNLISLIMYKMQFHHL
ncbi:hypothetical protein D5086_009324, partial [Populus alba]